MSGMRRANMIRHVGAAGAERPGRTICAVFRSLVLHLCVEISPEKDNHHRQPNPNHEPNTGTQRAVGFVVAVEVGNIPGEQHRRRKPEHSRRDTAPSYPPPPPTTAAWAAAAR